MCTLGMYYVSGVLNTTYVTQETDQNYSLFKSMFRDNIETLSHAIFDSSNILMIIDLPLLVF